MKVKLYLINWINKHHYVCQKYFHQKLVTFHAYNYDIAIWQHCFSSCHHTTSLNYHFFFFLIFVAPFLFLMVKMLFKVSCCEVSYYNKSNRRLQLVKFCRFLCWIVHAWARDCIWLLDLRALAALAETWYTCNTTNSWLLLLFPFLVILTLKNSVALIKFGYLSMWQLFQASIYSVCGSIIIIENMCNLRLTW